MSRMEALKSYTLNGAFAAFQERMAHVLGFFQHAPIELHP